MGTGARNRGKSRREALIQGTLLGEAGIEDYHPSAKEAGESFPGAWGLPGPCFCFLAGGQIKLDNPCI